MKVVRPVARCTPAGHDGSTSYLGEGLNENQRRPLVIADNKVSLNAGWDEEMLRLEIEVLDNAEYALSIIGLEDVAGNNHVVASSQNRIYEPEFFDRSCD
jgi:hypothetical protein